MKNYYRVMLGKGSEHAEECFKNNFIGIDYEIYQDLTKDLTDDWREFNKKFIPIHLQSWPNKTKVAAGLACGAVWSVTKGMNRGDIVVCPDGSGSYRVGEVADDYYYAAGQILPHRRKVLWYPNTIEKSALSEPMKRSVGSQGAVCNIIKYADEVAQLLAGNAPHKLISTDETVENPTEFALEEHLEDFLVKNWQQTELGKKYDIFKDGDEVIGQQYPADNKDRIDILAISKDKKELLVVELKKGRASDLVVGQIQRYMGFVLEELAEENQTVHGIIIALEDDLRIRRALTVARNIEFYRYQIDFKLVKA